ncbi:hypothetical protein AB0O01_33255 [Streptomyces sp. NPDC093252]|uniref:Rv1733c family protein n=1 Tax=Streptomyces sp. NPDC093252 TaxID=3154980 RepID=UPI00343DD121
MSGAVPPAQPPPRPRPERPLRPVRPVPFWRWRRNPLRRRTDRLEAWSALALVLLVPLLGLTALFGAGDAAERHYRAVAAREAQTRHHLAAVLVRDAPEHPEPGSDEARLARYPAEVRFTAPDGRTRTAAAEVPPGLAAGDGVRVWVAADGTPAGPPMTADEIRSRTMGWALLAFLAVALAGCAVHGAAVLALRRRNLATWDAHWAETAPRWTTST